MELESHRLFISLRNSLFASTIPVSPCMGSIIIAAVLSEIKFLTELMSLNIACLIPSINGENSFPESSEPPKVIFKIDLP